MDEIAAGFIKAIELIVTLDPEVMEITLRTLKISLTSTFLAALIFMPIGSIIHFNNFRGKRILINIIQTLFALPTVIVGLFVFLMLSRSGPFGFLNLFFTPAGMVIAQVILIAPIITGLTISALSNVERDIKDTIISLGATQFQLITSVIREERYAIFATILVGFGRTISEVGCAMMVGGNIRGFTRVLTTAIALETSIGYIELSIALGIILLSLALIINIAFSTIQQR